MKGARKDIRCSVSTQHHELVIKNWIILKSVVEIIVLCGKQNIALRRHEEENSHLIAILHDKAQHYEVLKTHLEKGDPKTKYTSPQIQNEITDVCGDMIKKSIIEPCIKSKYFGFIADEATDVATMEQMALCIRYYNIDKKKIKEKFIGFSECKSTTGENLANAFISNIREAGLDIQNIRGQGYDGAANMSGCHRGVKTRIQQIVPGAVYTHCKAHNLNLAIIHDSKDALVRNMFGVVQQITFHFNYSAKRQRNFKNCVNRCCIKPGDARTNKTAILVWDQMVCKSRFAVYFQIGVYNGLLIPGRLGTELQWPKGCKLSKRRPKLWLHCLPDCHRTYSVRSCTSISPLSEERMLSTDCIRRGQSCNRHAGCRKSRCVGLGRTVCSGSRSCKQDRGTASCSKKPKTSTKQT